MRFGNNRQVSAGMRAIICDIYDNQCVYCPPSDKPVPLVVDHFDPWARGGASTVNNLVPACFRCNSVKSDKKPEEWLALMKVNNYRCYVRFMAINGITIDSGADLIAAFKEAIEKLTAPPEIKEPPEPEKELDWGDCSGWDWLCKCYRTHPANVNAVCGICGEGRPKFTWSNVEGGRIIPNGYNEKGNPFE
jgi:HNH endonuclease